MLGMFSSPISFVNTTSHMSELGLQFFRTSGYQIPMLGMLSSSLVDKAILQHLSFFIDNRCVPQKIPEFF
jgi:hypothetical protein